MNPKAISASKTPLHLSLNPSQLSTRKSPIVTLPFNISNTHIGKRGLSIKTASGSHRLRQKAAAAAAINNLYVAAPEPETFYELLGIPETGTLTEIKGAYKQMALKYHPDVSPPDRVEEYTRKFIRVQEAYEILSDPGTRAMYDSDMAKGLHLAFSGRKGVRFDERSADKSGWRDRWENQIVELKRRSATKNSKVDSRGRMSWGARIRQEWSE